MPTLLKVHILELELDICVILPMNWRENDSATSDLAGYPSNRCSAGNPMMSQLHLMHRWSKRKPRHSPAQSEDIYAFTSQHLPRHLRQISKICAAGGDLYGIQQCWWCPSSNVVIVWRSCVSFVLYCNQRQIEHLAVTVPIKLESILVIVSTLVFTHFFLLFPPLNAKYCKLSTVRQWWGWHLSVSIHLIMCWWRMFSFTVSNDLILHKNLWHCMSNYICCFVWTYLLLFIRNVHEWIM